MRTQTLVALMGILVLSMLAIMTVNEMDRRESLETPTVWIHEGTGCHYFLVGKFKMPVGINDDHGAPYCPGPEDGFFQEHGKFDLTEEGQRMMDAAESIIELEPVEVP